MALFARIDGGNNKVQQVIVAEQSFVNNQMGTWIECTDRQPILNSTYDSGLDKFIPVQPYDSWTLNAEKTDWIPPVEKPAIDEASGKRPVWNEGAQEWEQK